MPFRRAPSSGCPIVAAIVLAFCLPRASDDARQGHGDSSPPSAVFVLSLGLLRGWDDGKAGIQFVESNDWIPQWGITYGLGVDGISLWLVLLTTFLTPLDLSRRAGTRSSNTRKEYVIAFLVLETAMIGAFVAIDLLLFYVFWELMLVPMYFIIGVWGGKNRIYAAIKFFLFTIAGIAADAAGDPLPRLPELSPDRQPDVRHRGPLRHVARSDGADAALLRLHAGLRDQGAALPAAHVAAGRARRGAHRRLDHPGRRDAEDGHVRLPALRAAALPRIVGALGRPA